MALNTKILVVGETRDGQVPLADVTSTFSPKIFVINERTENELQQLFLGKYLTQKTTALLKKAFTQIRTALPKKKTNHVQSSLHRVKRFQTLRRLRKNVASYTKQDFSAISFPQLTLSTVECSLRFQS